MSDYEDKPTDQIAHETWYAVFRQSDRDKQTAIIKAAILEATKQAWQEHDDVVRALEISNQTIKQLGARNQQLREERDELSRLYTKAIEFRAVQASEHRLPHDWNKGLPVITHLTPPAQASKQGEDECRALLGEAYARLGNTAFPSLAARIAQFLSRAAMHCDAGSPTPAAKRVEKKLFIRNCLTKPGAGGKKKP